MTEAAELIAKMAAGLKGTTPGPWHHYHAPLREGMTTIDEIQCRERRNPIVQWGGFDNSFRSKAKHKRNAAHIARCSPDNIRLLLDHIETLEARVATLSAALEPFSGLAAVRYPEEGGARSHIDIMTDNGEQDEIELRSFTAASNHTVVISGQDFRVALAAREASR